MYNYCIFLRGINVNGVKIKMVELREFFSSLGYDTVKTILATGNIILSLDEAIDDLNTFKEDLERKLSDHYGYEAYLFIRDFESIEALVVSAKQLDTSLSCHIYALILETSRIQDELLEVFNTYNHSENESLKKIKHDMFWVIEKGQTLVSEFGKKALGKKYFKSKVTSRNMNTINKIYQHML